MFKVRVVDKFQLVVEEDTANSSNNCGMPELPSPIPIALRCQCCSDEKGSPLLWDTRNCIQLGWLSCLGSRWSRCHVSELER